MGMQSSQTRKHLHLKPKGASHCLQRRRTTNSTLETFIIQPWSPSRPYHLSLPASPTTTSVFCSCQESTMTIWTTLGNEGNNTTLDYFTNSIESFVPKTKASTLTNNQTTPTLPRKTDHKAPLHLSRMRKTEHPSSNANTKDLASTNNKLDFTIQNIHLLLL